MSLHKPRLSWDQISNLNFTLDVVLLQGHDDVCQKSWANPLLCNATWAWCKLQWAHEEIKTVCFEAHQAWPQLKMSFLPWKKPSTTFNWLTLSSQSTFPSPHSTVSTSMHIYKPNWCSFYLVGGKEALQWADHHQILTYATEQCR